MSFHPRIHGATNPADFAAATAFPFIPAYTGQPSLLHLFPCVILSSPHTRGNHRRQGGFTMRTPFIPAYTGQPIMVWMARRFMPFHPRIHGATALPRNLDGRVFLSSPHTRGNLVAQCVASDFVPFIPAYTGQPLLPTYRFTTDFLTPSHPPIFNLKQLIASSP